MTGDRAIGLELRDGNAIGRDPRRMTAEELTAAGHLRMSPQKALRLRCIDCSGGSAAEVRLCTSVQCPAWPFRMGSNPWRPPASAAQREQRRVALAARMAATLGTARSFEEENAAEGVAATTLPADGDAGEIHRGAGEKRP